MKNTNIIINKLVPYISIFALVFSILVSIYCYNNTQKSIIKYPEVVEIDYHNMTNKDR
jgi:hypothetical protein